VVHGFWAASEEGGLLQHVSRQSLKEDTRSKMAEHLEQQAEQMTKVTAELLTILGGEINREGRQIRQMAAYQRRRTRS
jgi:hypothetical protein